MKRDIIDVQYLQFIVSCVVAITVVPAIAAEQTYRPSCVRVIPDKAYVLPLYITVVLPALFQVITGSGNPLAAHVRAKE